MAKANNVGVSTSAQKPTSTESTGIGPTGLGKAIARRSGTKKITTSATTTGLASTKLNGANGGTLTFNEKEMAAAGGDVQKAAQNKSAERIPILINYAKENGLSPYDPTLLSAASDDGRWANWLAVTQRATDTKNALKAEIDSIDQELASRTPLFYSSSAGGSTPPSLNWSGKDAAAMLAGMRQSKIPVSNHLRFSTEELENRRKELQAQYEQPASVYLANAAAQVAKEKKQENLSKEVAEQSDFSQNAGYLVANFAAGIADWGRGFVNAAEGVKGILGVNTSAPSVVQSAVYGDASLGETAMETTIGAYGDHVSDGMRTIGGTVARGIGYTAPSMVLGALLPGGGATSMLKNPQFWMTAIPMYGSSYKEAKRSGATEKEAQYFAVLNGFAGAAVEVGGGVQTIPGSKGGILKWVRSALEEGGEEVVQGVIENLAKKVIYDRDKEWVSLTDPDAVFSGKRMAQEFGSGVLIGSILGAPTSLAQTMANNAEFNRIGSQVVEQVGGDIGQATAAVTQMGLKTAPGTDTYAAAEKMAQNLLNGKTPSTTALGRLMAEVQSPEAVKARAIYDKTIASGQALGVDGEVSSRMAQVAARFGIETEWVSPETLQINKNTAADGSGVNTPLAGAEDTAGMPADVAQGRYIPATYTVNEQGERVVKTPARILLNAAYADGNWQKLLNFVIKHELTHSIEGTSAWEAMVRTVQRSMGKDGWNAAVEQVRAERQAAGDAAGVANPEAELIANWVGDNLYKADFIHTMVQSNTRAAGRLVGILDRVRLALGGEGKNPTVGQIAALERTFLKALESGETIKNTADEGGARYSISPSISADVDRVLNGTFDANKNEVYIGETSNFLTNVIGADAISQYMPASKVYSAIVTYDEYLKNPYYAKQENYHGLGKDTFLEVLARSEEPIVAFASRADNSGNKRQNRIVLVTDKLVTDIETGKSEYAVAVTEVDTRSLVGGKRVKANKTITVYPMARLASDIQEAAAEGRLLDITKKGEQILAGVRGSNPQAAIQKSVLKKNIANFWANVKWNSANAQTTSSSASNQQTLTPMQLAFQKASYTDQSGQIQSMQNGGKNTQPPGNSSTGQNSILSPERMAEFEGAAQETETVPEYEYTDEEAAVAVEEVRQQKLTQRQQEQKAALAALTERYRAGQLTDEQFLAEQMKVVAAGEKAVAKDYTHGRRGTTAEKAAVKEINRSTRETVYGRTEQYRQEQETKEDSRRATALRGEATKILDQLQSMLNNQTKKRHIPTDLVGPVVEVLEAVTEDTAGVEQDIARIKHQLLETTDPRRQEQLLKALGNRERKLAKLSEKLGKLERAYSQWEQAPRTLNDKQHPFEEQIRIIRDIIGERSLRELTYDETKQLVDVLKSITRQIDNVNSLRSKAFKEAADETGTKWLKEIRDVKRSKTFGADLLTAINLWQLSPERAFQAMSGWVKDSAGSQIAAAMIEAQEKQLQVRRDWGMHFAEFSNAKEYEKLTSYKESDLVDVGLKDSKGEPILLTRGIMLSLYEVLSCPGNRQMIIDGGFEIPRFKPYYTGNVKDSYTNCQRCVPSDTTENIHTVLHKMEKADTAEQRKELQQEYDALVRTANQDLDRIQKQIEEKMTDYEKRLHKAVREWFDVLSKQYINEATEQVWGYQVARVNKYYPGHRDTDFVNTDMESLIMDRSLEGMGSLKTRVRSKKPVLLTDISAELDRSCDQVARFFGFMPFIADFNRIYNYTADGNADSVKKALGDVYGKKDRNIGVTATKYIENLIADFSGARSSGGGWLHALRQNSVRATMALNLRVAVSQLGALPTAAAEVGWRHMSKAVAHLGKVDEKKFETMLANSEYLYERCRGSGGMEEFALAKENVSRIDKIYNKVDKATRGYLLGWCEKVDQKTAIALWYACESKVQEEHPQLKPESDAFNKKVGEELNRVIRKTQSNYTTAERSDLLRETREGTKLLTMFKTDANQSFNIVYEATARYRKYKADFAAGKNNVTEADVKNAKKKMVNSYAAVVTGNILISVVLRTLINFLMQRTDDLRDEEGEYSFGSIASAVGQEALSNAFGMFVLGDAIYDVISAKLFDDSYYGMSDMGLDLFGDLLRDLATGNFGTAKGWENLVFDLFKVAGVPIKNFKDLVQGVIYHAEDIANGEFMSMEAGAKLTEANYYLRMYRAMQSGDTEKAERVRLYFLAAGKTESEIRSGLKKAIKDTDEMYRRQYDKAMQEVFDNTVYISLEEREQKKVQSRMANYLADVLLAEYTGEELTATNQKAAKYEEKGVAAEDYFLAQVLRSVFATDKNGDGKISAAEKRQGMTAYRQALQQAGFDEVTRRALSQLKL